MDVKPPERPAFKRYVIRNPEGFYYDGHGYSSNEFGAYGEPGVPGFRTRDILYAIKYGDTESIDRMNKNHKMWCIEHDRHELLTLIDSCEVLETYT